MAGDQSVSPGREEGGKGVIKDSLLIKSQQRLARRERIRKIVKGEGDIVRGSDIHREGQRQISGLARG